MISLGPSLGAFLGSSFLVFLSAYMLFNLKSDQTKKRYDDGTEVIKHNVQHKFLQLILWGIIILALIINSVAVMDMSSRQCDWLMKNETVSGAVTNYEYEYECMVLENGPALQYQSLIYRFGIPLLSIYIVLYFIVMSIAKIGEMRKENRRNQGR